MSPTQPTRGRPRSALVVGGAIALVLLAVLAVGLPRLLGGGGEGSLPAAATESERAARQPASEAAELPASPEPAFTVARPEPLRRTRDVSRWASVLREVPARTAPAEESRVVASLARTTAEGTTNIVLVLDRDEDAAGRLWIRVRVPALPNGQTGWVPRTALGGYGLVRTRLVVDRRRLTATLFRGGRKVFEAPVGIGREAWPTPPGDFYIRNKLKSYDDPFYGPLAFGTSARSAVLTDWPAGGFVGIHGTNQPELVPGRISHGCIRLKNPDILRLGRLMPVGTPLTVL